MKRALFSVLLGLCWLLSPASAAAFESVVLELLDCNTGAYEAATLLRLLRLELVPASTTVELGTGGDDEVKSHGYAVVQLVPEQCAPEATNVEVRVKFVGPGGRVAQLLTQVALDDVASGERSRVLAVAVSELLRVAKDNPTAAPSTESPPEPEPRPPVRPASVPRAPTPSLTSEVAPPLERRGALDAYASVSGRGAGVDAFWGGGVGGRIHLSQHLSTRLGFEVERASVTTGWGGIDLTVLSPSLGVDVAVLRDPNLTLGPVLSVPIVALYADSPAPGIDEGIVWQAVATIGARTSLSGRLSSHAQLFVAIEVGTHIRSLSVNIRRDRLFSFAGLVGHAEVGVVWEL